MGAEQERAADGAWAKKNVTNRTKRNENDKTAEASNKLTRHNSKKKRPPKRSKASLLERMHELYKAPGESARQAILQIKLAAHESYPSIESALSIASLTEQFEREREIERKDPVSFEEAKIKPDEVQRIFFSPVSEFDYGSPGPRSPEDIEAQWMARWITPFEGQKRGVDEWCKLIGFTGEYLESNWTSSLRKFTFPELPAISDQNSLSDFTYEDENGTMAAFLNIPGDGGRVFHIEVKTSKEVEDGFSFSPRQFKTMQNAYFGNDKNSVYVVLKVDNTLVVKHARVTQIIENPLKYFFEGKMALSCDSTMRASWK